MSESNGSPQADPHALLGREVMFRPLYSETYVTARVEGVIVTDKGLFLDLDTGQRVHADRVFRVEATVGDVARVAPMAKMPGRAERQPPRLVPADPEALLAAAKDLLFYIESQPPGSMLIPGSRHEIRMSAGFYHAKAVVEAVEAMLNDPAPNRYLRTARELVGDEAVQRLRAANLMVVDKYDYQRLYECAMRATAEAPSSTHSGPSAR